MLLFPYDNVSQHVESLTESKKEQVKSIPPKDSHAYSPNKEDIKINKLKRKYTNLIIKTQWLSIDRKHVELKNR